MNTTAFGMLAEAGPLETVSGAMEHCPLRYDSACEVELVAAAKSGDHHAFTELCRRYLPLLRRRIWKIIRNREDLEDILQDTLMGAYKHLEGFRAECSFRTWIMTIATNNGLMLVRKRRNHPETGLTRVTPEGDEVEILEMLDPMPNPEQAYAKRQTTQKISRAVKKLPAGIRLIMERYHRDEQQLVDVAKAIGITVGAAKSRLLRGRKTLLRHLSYDRSRWID